MREARLPDAAPTDDNPARTRRARDARLDALRGLALATIFVNHVPGNVFEAATLRNFGFSDAAEAFVLMAGISAGLAYGPSFRPGGEAWAGLWRVWGRAWTLYLVHLLVTVAALAVAAGFALWADLPGLLRLNRVDLLLGQPLEALAGLPLLRFQVGYADILPVYAALLLVAPAILWLGWRAPRALLGGSVLLWLAAGELRLNLPTSPSPAGWLLSPFSWQVLFVVGALAGIRAREGRRLVPARGWLVALAAGFLILALAWRVVPVLGESMGHGLRLLAEAGLPWTLTAFHKTWETAPRLLHALALAYLLATLPAVRRACERRWAAPLRLLGRHALPVFALGSVLAFVVQGIKTETGAAPLLDGFMLGGGLFLQLALAWARDRTRGLGRG
jgi:hypothetical protein